MTIFAKRALLSTGWARDVRLTVQDGKIGAITPQTQAQTGDVAVDTLLPSIPNLHSHSFQRAMAGMTEYRAQGRESFWTWRDLMYRFLDHLTPEHVSAIAAQTFMEMQKAGYAAVGEFHYVHNQTGGTAYDNPAELSERIFEAAALTGIGLTHLPVLYTYGGADRRALAGGQLRFRNSADSFANLTAQCRAGMRSLPADCTLGIAPHSLRATSPQDLQATLAAHAQGPVHIHIAEQVKEVEEITHHLGTRPVEWLLAELPVDSRWCLIHATHMTEDETRNMASTGAVAGLCPITESNLGDGIFNGAAYLEAEGVFGVGSDSNINISLTEELRTLEYSQRLRDQSRNVLAFDSCGSTGTTLYLGAAAGGACALGRDCGHIEIGALADLVAIDAQDPTLCALRDDQLLDGLAFAAKDNVITDLWSAGRHQVQGGTHVLEAEITDRYRAAISDLTAQLG